MSIHEQNFLSQANENGTNARMSGNVFQLLILFFFVVSASYLVLHHEYQEGAFVYYFFKAKFYYASHNKVVFPIYFWGSFLLTVGALQLIRKEKLGIEQILDFSRYALCFHIYLLFLTCSREVTPGFTLLPSKIPPLPNITLYEDTFMAIGFIAYYCLAIHIIVKLCNGNGKIWETIFPMSIFIPYFFLESPWLHFIYFGISTLVCFFLRNSAKIQQTLRAGFSAKWAVPALIFAVGLYFRLWYAGYLASFGENTAGFSADGPAYFKSAMAFSEGAIEKVDFWHAPFYALYLSVFLSLFGRSPETAVYSQAVVGAFAPILLYYLARRLGGEKLGIIAGLLMATSHLCIHFSTIIHRADLLQITLPTLLLFCLTLTQHTSAIKYLAWGSLFGASFYCAQEMLPSLFVFFSALVFAVIKSGVDSRQIVRNFAGVAAGIILALLPLNLFFFHQTGKWIPLGRDSSYIQQGELLDSWTFGKSEAAFELEKKLGCNPLKSLTECFGVFLDQPLKVSALFIEKTLHELPGFLFDPGSIFIAPWHLTFESFYGANLQFYVYLAVLSGLLILRMRKDIKALEKTLILSPIALQLLTNTIFLFGTYRYRAPITPFNLILLAFAAEACFTARPDKRGVEEKKPGIPAFSHPFNFYKNFGKPIIHSTIMAFAAALIVAGYSKHEPRHTGPAAKSEVAPWTAPHKTQKKLVHTHEVQFNSTVFAFYQLLEEELSTHDLFVSFNICRFLMPGMKPYYRLALDGQMIGEPRKIPAGCSSVTEKLQPEFAKGMLSLFAYISTDGKTFDLKSYKLNISDTESITIPFFSNFSLSEEQKQYSDLFDNFSNGYIKVSTPILIKRPK